MQHLPYHIGAILRLPEAEVRDELCMNAVDTWDSLSHMELVVALEQAYGVCLSGDDIVDMTSVAAIRAVLARHLAGAN